MTGVAALLCLGLAAPGPAVAEPTVVDGVLFECPHTDNCVSSLSRRAERRVAPLAFRGEPARAWRRLKDALSGLPRVEIVEETDAYLHAVATSLVFRFRDDVEFLLSPEGGRIDVRSASRVGRSDLGVNRRRVEAIRKLFEASAPGTSATATRPDNP